jgi:K+-transporting ATPase ATPase C chain
MRQFIRPAIVSLLIFTVLTGLIYPLSVTGLARLLFPYQAGGSLIVANGHHAGSALIGQPFDDSRYFWGRPSATAPFPYNGASSTGSNLGPSNPDLRKAIKLRVAALRKADPDNRLPIPVDLVTASGSGLDPHISPAAALYQVSRVAKARGVDEKRVRSLVNTHIRDRALGIFGEPVIAVLELNMALDALR